MFVDECYVMFFFLIFLVVFRSLREEKKAVGWGGGEDLCNLEKIRNTRFL